MARFFKFNVYNSPAGLCNTRQGKIAFVFWIHSVWLSYFDVNYMKIVQDLNDRVNIEWDKYLIQTEIHEE